MANLFDELTWRELVYDATEGLSELLSVQSVTVYAGFDPTASSLHVGHLLPLMGLARMQRFGHTPIAIVGGGTGMIGDPSGKSQERNLLSADQIEQNVAGIRVQLERFLDFSSASNAARIVNNADWLGTVDLLTFLRDAGKHFTVNSMLQKESVNRRRPPATWVASSASSPGSWNGALPDPSVARLASSISTPSTSWPSSAMQAAWVAPRYPQPMTVIRTSGV